MNEYEQQRLENIKRNQAMLMNLNIPTLVSHTTGEVVEKQRAAAKQRAAKRRRKSEEARQPKVLRRSLRGKGLAPEPSTDKGGKIVEELFEEEPGRKEGNLDFKDCRVSWDDEDGKESSHSRLEAAFTSFPKKNDEVPESKLDHAALGGMRCSFAAVKVVKKRGLCLTFHPASSAQRTLVAAGDKEGMLGFMEYGSEVEHEPGDTVAQYRPFDSALSGIKWNPSDSSKLVLSSYDGSLRVMDVNSEKFVEAFVCSEEYMQQMFAINKTGNTVYIGDHKGHMNIVDLRTARTKAHTRLIPLHRKKISTIDLHPTNEHILLTSSNDRSAKIWDARKLVGYKKETAPPALFDFTHGLSASSGFFSPEGSFVLTTGMDNILRVYSLGDPARVLKGGKEADIPVLKVRHNNQTGRWVTTFRAKWSAAAPDPLSFCVGNMKKRVDFYSMSPGGDGEVESPPLLCSIADPYLTAIPAVVEWHPRLHQAASLNASGYIHVFNPGT